MQDAELGGDISWAEQTALKLGAAFRHMSQEALRCRKWVPQAVVG